MSVQYIGMNFAKTYEQVFTVFFNSLYLKYVLELESKKHTGNSNTIKQICRKFVCQR